MTDSKTAGRWRVGRKLGRTLYVNDQVVGMVDTPELAAAIVATMNGAEAPQPERPDAVAVWLRTKAQRTRSDQDEDADAELAAFGPYVLDCVAEYMERTADRIERGEHLTAAAEAKR